MKKKWIAAIIIYLAAMAACIVIVYVVPSVKGMLEKTYVTEYGKIDITDKVSAYILRDETVYVAAQDSKIKRLAETDKLIKARKRIVELTPIENEEEEALKEAGPDASQETAEASAALNGEMPDNISRKYVKIMEDLNGEFRSTQGGYMKDAGYISYSVDGAEAKLSTANLDNLNRDDYETLTKLRAVDTPASRCGKGEPVFKVIHNSKWYLVFYIDSKAGEKYYEGQTVSIDVGGKNVPVKVIQVQPGKDSTKVVISCKTFFEGFLKERSLNTTITVASAEGLVLQDSSIVMKEDQPGVFVKNKLGEHRFKPISVMADDGERCVVYADIYVDEGGNYVETLKTYDEIVAEPSEEEIAALQEQASAEAAERAEREAAEKAEREAAERAEREAEEKAAREALAAQKAAKEKEDAEKAAAEKAAADKETAEETADQTEKEPAEETSDKAEKEPAEETSDKAEKESAEKTATDKKAAEDAEGQSKTAGGADAEEPSSEKAGNE